jgi:hypothetical protein
MPLRILATASGSTGPIVGFLDQDAAVGAHGERGADGFLRLLRTDRDGDDSVAVPASFSRTASSTAISSNGFIDILTLARSTPAAVGLDADLDVVVNNPLDRHEISDISSQTRTFGCNIR